MTSEQPHAHLLTLNEVAQELKISRRTAYRYLSDGVLQGAKVGAQWRFSHQQIAEIAQISKGEPEPQPRLLMGDLFSGAGGLTEGFHQAGFTSVFANDIAPDTETTYTRNFPGVKFYLKPIQELTAEEVMRDVNLRPGELDLLIGGPPCQGFSINAPIRSGDDERNHLFRHYVRLVLEGLRPKAVLFENVPGLLSMGETIHDVSEAFKAAGYKVKYKLLNAAHYGVPQERWRLFILGTRLPELSVSFPEPLHYSLSRVNFRSGKDTMFADAVWASEKRQSLAYWLRKPISVFEALDDLPVLKNGQGGVHAQYVGQPATEFQTYCRAGAGDNLWNHQAAKLAAPNLERFVHVPPGGSWRDIPHELLPAGMQRARRSDHTKRYGRLHPDALSGTVLTKCDPHWGTFVHYRDNRIISVREAARIQSFPDRFVFTGNVTSQYKQVGNAVPPLLARAIAAEIRAALEVVQDQQARQVTVTS